MSPESPHHRSRGGFALPLAVLVLALMTATTIAAFTSTTAEIISNNAMRAQTRAYQYAETGMQLFMLRRGEPGFCSNCVADPALADSEWTRVSFPGGYADVVAMRVRPRINPSTPPLFFVRSLGVDTTVKMGGISTPVFARRAVGQYASFGTATIRPLGAWTSFNGISNNLGNLSYSQYDLRPANGNDVCSGALPDVAGVVVPKNGSANYRPDAVTTTLGWHPAGTPRVDSTRVLDSLKKYAGVDWEGILNRNAIPADITIPGGTTTGWPTAAQWADTSYWPVIRFKGNATLPSFGRGILIVEGRLTLVSNYDFYGIILVGNDIVINSFSSGYVVGAVISGLNKTLPGATNPPPDLVSDNDVVATVAAKQILYGSCANSRATERLKSYFAWPNTWMDNVAIW